MFKKILLLAYIFGFLSMSTGFAVHRSDELIGRLSPETPCQDQTIGDNCIAVLGYVTIKPSLRIPFQLDMPKDPVDYMIGETGLISTGQILVGLDASPYAWEGDPETNPSKVFLKSEGIWYTMPVSRLWAERYYPLQSRRLHRELDAIASRLERSEDGEVFMLPDDSIKLAKTNRMIAKYSHLRQAMDSKDRGTTTRQSPMSTRDTTQYYQYMSYTLFVQMYLPHLIW